MESVAAFASGRLNRRASALPWRIGLKHRAGLFDLLAESCNLAVELRRAFGRGLVLASVSSAARAAVSSASLSRHRWPRHLHSASLAAVAAVTFALAALTGAFVRSLELQLLCARLPRYQALAANPAQYRPRACVRLAARSRGPPWRQGVRKADDQREGAGGHDKCADGLVMPPDANGKGMAEQPAKRDTAVGEGPNVSVEIVVRGLEAIPGRDGDHDRAAEQDQRAEQSRAYQSPFSPSAASSVRSIQSAIVTALGLDPRGKRLLYVRPDFDV